MRILSRSLALGALVLLGMSNGSLLAQNQNDPGADAAQAAAPSQAPIMQAQPRQAPNPQRQAMRMAKKLSLTPDQAAQLEPILAERLQQMRIFARTPR
jgi:Spy/CpxP family protein refolding chaperone